MRAARLATFLLGALPLVGSLAFVPADAYARTTDSVGRPAPIAGSPAGGEGEREATSRRACDPAPGPDRATCLALVRTDLPALRSLTPRALPPGYGPADLRSAYQLPRFAGQGRTVAIVNAFHNPTAESDLAVYRSTFGLPPCTTANGCFRRINQTGGTTPPVLTDPGWALETALDIDMVSAACPACKILLVEANDDTFGSLLTAVAQARTQGAKYISMSWSDPNGENNVQPVLDQIYFNFPGIAFVGSSGNTGGVVHWPAASQYVTAAGGTSLRRNFLPVPGPQLLRLGWYESAWQNSGSGCSQVQPKPSFQHDPLCPRRTSADVSAVADPATGVAVYDTSGSGAPGWKVVGGTSAAAPLIASMYALAGTPGPADRPNSYPYAHRLNFWDIDRGVVGVSCPGNTYLCRAVRGYDGPTGVGTPRGVLGLRR